MRITLQLTPDQAQAIVHAWSVESWMAASDRNPFYPHDRAPLPGTTAWTHGPAGYMTEGPGRHRWLTDHLDLGEVFEESVGNWIYRFSGSPEGLRGFARYPVPGLDWEGLPVLDRQIDQ